MLPVKGRQTCSLSPGEDLGPSAGTVVAERSLGLPCIIWEVVWFRKRDLRPQGCQFPPNPPQTQIPHDG